jgi:hypothetical protein
LSGFNAVLLPGIGWYRVDPRGNRPGFDAQCDPPAEQLAFRITVKGEADLPGIHSEPLRVVVDALRSHPTAQSLWDNLPDAGFMVGLR